MKKTFSAAVLLFLAILSIHSENWAHWRGPHYDGSTDEKNLPGEFSKTQNVKWSAALPGMSAATPIIWGDYVFISSGEEKSKCLRALAVDRKTGKILWEHEVGIGYSQDEKSNFASPSPVTDGKVVVFLYGNGELAAFDPAGKSLATCWHEYVVHRSS